MTHCAYRKLLRFCKKHVDGQQIQEFIGKRKSKDSITRVNYSLLVQSKCKTQMMKKYIH